MKNKLTMLSQKTLAIYSLIFCLFPLQFLMGQGNRATINEGVDFYNEQKFPEAETNFKKGIESEYESFEGHFNLGDAYYKQERYDEAMKSFMSSMAITEDNLRKSSGFYNIGNSLLKSKKLEESIEAYKNSLKLNPSDMEAKYNLSYALEMLKNQQKQNQDQNQNKDQKDQNNKDQNKDQQQNNQDQNKDKQDQDKNQDQQDQNQQNNQDKKDQQNQPQPQPEQRDQISKQEAQRILEALKDNEADLQKKLRKRVGKPVKTEKDW